MACCLLILLFVKEELSYDHYHQKIDRIYRVLHAYRYTESSEELPPAAAEEFQVWGNAPVGPALLADFPEIQSVFQFMSPPKFLLQYGEKRFQEDNIVFADSTAFEIFSWNLIAGDPTTALKAPDCIVLTQTTARKYFGDQDPLGETLTVGQGGVFTVTGVMEDIPNRSHFTFDGMVSMTTLQKGDPEFLEWWDYVDFYTYFLVTEHADIRTMQDRVPEFIQRYSPEGVNYSIAFEPMTDAYLHSVAGRQPGITGSMSNVYIFASIALFILLIAVINFVNLTTAQSVERAKEVGVRKTMGAVQRTLLFQFLAESVLLSVLAAVLAGVLMTVLVPVVQDISGKPLSVAEILSEPMIFTLLILGVLLVGILAGIYPARILAYLQPTLVLKSRHRSAAGGSILRKGLVVFQFSMSIALMVGSVIVFTQLRHLRTQDLGFQQEQMLVIDFGWDGIVQQQIEAFKTEYLRLPAVHSVAVSRMVPGDFFPKAKTSVASPEGIMVEENPDLFEIDADFISHYGMEMVAGRAFSADFPADSSKSRLLIEAAVRRYGYIDP